MINFISLLNKAKVSSSCLYETKPKIGKQTCFCNVVPPSEESNFGVQKKKVWTPRVAEYSSHMPRNADACAPPIDGSVDPPGIVRELTSWLLRKPPHERVVACVGSSGNLLGRGHGAAIDAASLVVRVNAPVLAGFEDDVGARTDVRVAWSRAWAHAVERNLTSSDELTILYCPTPTYSVCTWPDWAIKPRRRAVVSMAWAKRLHSLLERSAFPIHAVCSTERCDCART